MLRLSTPDFKRFVQADTFDITYGGGEANVSAGAADGAGVSAGGATAAAAAFGPSGTVAGDVSDTA